MERPKPIWLVGTAAAALLLVLMTAVVLGARLLANREMVNTLIARKTYQATGGVLDYDRLEIRFWPRLHLTAHHFRLHRPHKFDIRAASLGVTPSIGSLLRGEVRIRQVSLTSPDGTLFVDPAGHETPAPAGSTGSDRIAHGIPTGISALFDALEVIDPASGVRIDDGRFTLAVAGQPAISFTGIHVHLQRAHEDLAMDVQGRADAAGMLTLQATVDMAARQASGQIALSDLNVHPLIKHPALTGGIDLTGTAARADLDFDIDGPETACIRFDLHFPTLTAVRSTSRLTVDQAAISGSLTYGGRQLSVSVDTLKAEQPDIQLSGGAVFSPDAKTGRASLALQAAAAELDLGTVGAIAQALAGDLQTVQTALAVVRHGRLSGLVFDAQLTTDQTGWRLNQMKASGRLSQGWVTIPGGLADLEQLEGELVFDGQRLAFTDASGHFKGTDLAQLQAVIDWSGEPGLAIRSSAVDVDSAPLFNWLTGFAGLAGIKQTVASIDGRATVSALKIDGPLTSPEQWAIAASATPHGLRLTGPLLPFAVSLSGGRIDYEDGRPQARGVTAAFLDGSLRVDYRSTGSAPGQSAQWHLDGSVGQESIDWLSTVLPIPEHLKIKPPVRISDARIVWDHATAMAFTGGVETGGVTLFADVARSADAWRIHRLTFSDGHSHVTASAQLQKAALELAFAGNLEKQTADRLFRNNRTLSGRLEGDFKTVIDTRNPLNSAFYGRLSGQGLQLHQLGPEPIELRQFAVDGHGSRLEIDSAEVSLLERPMTVSGVVDRGTAGLTFDLDLKTDHLDDAMLRALLPAPEATAAEAAPTTARGPTGTMVARGDIHLQTASFAYGDRTWSDVEADIELDPAGVHIRVDKADLCGISTTGEVDFSPHGLGFSITPAARAVSLEDTVRCLTDAQVKADARFDLGGVIQLPPTRKDPLESMTGQLQLTSANGKIITTSTLVKIASYLSASRLLADARSDFSRNGLAFRTAEAQARIGGGNLQLTEFVLDGETMKITGQGRVELSGTTADITVLVAPLRTVDRLVGRLPIIGNLTGGTLISIPFRLTGPLNDLRVTPLPPAAVGKGLLDIMERTLKAPVKVVQGAAERVSGEITGTEPSQPMPVQKDRKKEN